jgi:hypothetical protein
MAQRVHNRKTYRRVVMIDPGTKIDEIARILKEKGVEGTAWLAHSSAFIYEDTELPEGERAYDTRSEGVAD